MTARSSRLFVSIVLIFSHSALAASQTRIGIRGSEFTINGKPTYSAASGFPSATKNIKGTLLNLRAVQSLFDDKNYPELGSERNPYRREKFGAVAFDYPDAPYSAERNLNEFLAALPDWQRCGVLAITVNLQGGGPTDGNFGVHTQPQLNSGFDQKGNLKPEYERRLRRIVEEADRLGMIVIVGYFYQGSEGRILNAPGDAYIATAITQASRFLYSLANRNILIELANEVDKSTYPSHPALQPKGILESVQLAQRVVHGKIPVSFSWIGDPPPRGTEGFQSLRTVDYVMFHTNGQTPEGVRKRIQAYRQAVGERKALLINEDGVSTFNLDAAVQQHVGWGYYDQGLNDYHNGFQSVPVDWKIGTLTKWLFFDQVARLTGSPEPKRPSEDDQHSPSIRMLGLENGDTVKPEAHIEAVVDDHDVEWPIRRVEFFIDGVPYFYTRSAPFYLGGLQGWDMNGVSPGKHMLRVVAYDQRGPAFTEVCSILDLSFVAADR